MPDHCDVITPPKIRLIADDELPIRGARYRGIFVDLSSSTHFFLDETHTASRPTTAATTASTAATIDQSAGLPHARGERMKMTNEIEDEYILQ